MDFTRKTYPHFHQAAIATALTLSVLSPAAWSAECSEYPAAPLTVNITGESEDFCDDQVSLREAIIYANDYLVGKDTVTFADSLKGHTIHATNGRIYVNESVAITGPEDAEDAEDAERITLKASDTAALFYIESFADRIDFDLKNATLEKAGGANHLIEMNGYGGDVNLDNIHTTDATRAYGVFSGSSSSNEIGENDLNLTLKNSSISGSTFDSSILSSWVRVGASNISIVDSEVLNNRGERFASAYSDNTESFIEVKRSNISGNTFSEEATYVYGEDNKATIDIIESTINENEARYIAHNYGYDGDAHLNISKSTISGNKVSTILRIQSEDENAHLNISDSTISANTISSYGVRTSGDNSSINIQNSILCDNITDYGGDVPGQYPLIAAYNVNALDISDSSICDNQLQAIRLYASYRTDAIASIKNSVINNNHSTASGAGIYATDGGKGTKLDLSISDSSISNNISNSAGGGISIKAYNPLVIDLNIHNSTISSNESGQGGIRRGGGISIDGPANIAISNSTITKNISSDFGGGVAIVWADESAAFSIKNSIIADNTSAYGGGDLYGHFTVESSLIKDTSATYNTTINGIAIDQIGDGEDQIPDTGNNLLGVDPSLQDLALSGGTWVHQLTAGSPAIAAGNTLTENLPAYDQRGEGFARIRTGNGVSELDLGAVQYFANPVAVNDVVAISLNSANNLIDVVANDEQNSDGLLLDSGSVTIMAHPENGTAEVQQDGTISYTPNTGFLGEDSLIYMLQDIAGNNSTEATVSITVSESSGDSGGPLNLWFISLLAVFGLRRNKHLKKSFK